LWARILRARDAGFAIAFALSFPGATTAQMESRGPEFQVNLRTQDDEAVPRVTMLGSQFVVVWVGRGNDGSEYGIGGRRFDLAGNPIGGDFQANTYTLGTQSRAAIDGIGSSFVVVWDSYGQDGDFYGVFGRVFNSAGDPLGIEFQVNAYTPGSQAFPAVAMSSSGFVVVWAGGSPTASIFGRRYDLSGAPLSGPFVVSTNASVSLFDPDVAIDAAGNFVVVWAGQPDGNSGIGGRRFDAGGNPLATEFLANLVTALDQRAPRVAHNGSSFVVVWDMVNGPVHGRRFSSDGTLSSGEFLVNAYSGDAASNPSIAMEQSGDFVVAWHDDFRDGSSLGVFGRRFDSDLSPLTGEVQVNSYVTGGQGAADVALAGSRFVVVWLSQNQDGAYRGIFGQRFRTGEFSLDVDGNGAITPLTDTLLLLRYAFGFRGAVLINGAVGAGCTRCTAPAIEEYLAGEL
jgi:hypothetical protein